jgi:hypothetical protein
MTFSSGVARLFPDVAREHLPRDKVVNDADRSLSLEDQGYFRRVRRGFERLRDARGELDSSSADDR